MSRDPIIFARSFEERLDDYQNILNIDLKATEINEQWCNYLELTVEPLGWQAIWMVSRDFCADLKISFPCTAIVTVQQVNFKDLSCTACVIEVEDVIANFPEVVTDIPLIDLYPTIGQDSSYALKLFETAKSIDSLRFFYNHLWMPWDLDNDEGNSWVISSLEGRLKLYFALMERKVPHEIAYTIRRLVSESRKIQKEIEDIQEQFVEETERNNCPVTLLRLTELHNRISSLKNQFTIYEKPELLGALIQRNQGIEKSQVEIENHESIVFLVMEMCTPEQLLRIAKLTSEMKLIRLYSTLQEALVRALPNSLVWVCQGRHCVHDFGNLEVGGTIKGVEPQVVLTEEVEGSSGWTVLRGVLILTNLTIQMTSVWNIIKVRPSAECWLQEILIEGSSITDAIDVFPSAKLVASNCHFANCSIAIICDINSTVKLSNCTFTNNNIAIEVKEGCSLTMENCSISESKLYGVNIRINPSTEICKDNIQSINSIPGLNEYGTTYKNNSLDFHFTSSCQKFTNSEASDSDLLSASR